MNFGINSNIYLPLVNLVIHLLIAYFVTVIPSISLESIVN